jgi:hypothetical protein
LLFNFALECAIRKVQENQVRQKFSGTHQFLVNAYDVSLLGGNLNTIKNITEALIDTSKEVGLAVNTENCVLMSHHQNAGQNQHKDSGQIL